MANKCVCGWGSAPEPAGRAYNAPLDPLDGLRGPNSKRKGREGGMGRGRERGVEGEEGGRGCLTSARGIKSPPCFAVSVHTLIPKQLLLSQLPVFTPNFTRYKTASVTPPLKKKELDPEARCFASNYRPISNLHNICQYQ